MTWQVQTSKNTFQQVKADFLEVASGCLVFYEDETPILSLALGEWMTVHLDVPDHEALKARVIERERFNQQGPRRTSSDMWRRKR